MGSLRCDYLTLRHQTDTHSKHSFLFGCGNLRLSMTFDDVHVLTLPGFSWARINPTTACCTAGLRESCRPNREHTDLVEGKMQLAAELHGLGSSREETEGVPKWMLAH